MYFQECMYLGQVVKFDEESFRESKIEFRP